MYTTPIQDYIHRVGRTARAGKSGYAVSLVNQYETEWFKMIEALLGNSFPCLSVSLAHIIGDYFVLKPSLTLTGKKIGDPRKVDADEIMILREHISDSRRIALTVCTRKANQFNISMTAGLILLSPLLLYIRN